MAALNSLTIFVYFVRSERRTLRPSEGEDAPRQSPPYQRIVIPGTRAGVGRLSIAN
jgi:hypothetical protein